MHLRRGRPGRHEPPEVPAADPDRQAALHRADRPALPPAGLPDGADGVLVSGCHPGDCHYTSGNYVARRRWVLFRELLDFVGLEPERLHFSWVSAAEGAKFVDVVKKVTEAVRAVGPFPGFAPAGSCRRIDPIGARRATPESAEPLRADAMRADLESGSVRADPRLPRGADRAGSLRPAGPRAPARGRAPRVSRRGDAARS